MQQGTRLSGFGLGSAKPTGYPIKIQITIHPLSTDGTIAI